MAAGKARYDVALQNRQMSVKGEAKRRTMVLWQFDLRRGRPNAIGRPVDFSEQAPL